MDFCPSISEQLLFEALQYAKSIGSVDDEIIDVIMHSRKSSLFDENNVWLKKENSNFDVTMGNYDGA